MAITIQHLYSTKVNVIFYFRDGSGIRCSDSGILDDIIERATEAIIKHDFQTAEIYQKDTGEILTIIERE